MTTLILETPRLLLRTWQDADSTPMSQINQDPQVMEFFPAVGNLEQTRTHIQRILDHQKKYGYSLYAVEHKISHQMIGFVGLIHRTKQEFNVAFSPCTEIGWRLSAAHWHQGYATEAAKSVLHYGFNQLKLDEIVSFTVKNNLASRRVMEKIGLIHDANGDFDQPKLEPASPLRRHVLYHLHQLQYQRIHTEDQTI